MIDKINIVYIDDNCDADISKYMRHEYSKEPFSSDIAIEKIYDEVTFVSSHGYESLLNNFKVRTANIILIDNRLFEEHTAGSGKFSGKQFKLILRKLFPFVEVLIITQDEEMDGHKIIHKFSGRHGESSDEYYNSYLKPVLNSAIQEVIGFEELVEELKTSEDVEKTLIEKVLLSLEGEDSFDELKKSDIDNLITVFKELKGRIQS